MEATFTWDELTQTYIFKVTRINWRYEKIKLQIFLDVLKSSIPAGHRDCEPKDRIWYIKESYYDILEPVMRNYFDNFHSTKKPDQSVSQNNIVPTEQYLKLFSEYGADVNGDHDWHNLSLVEATKVYRKIAIKYHPDKNPNGAEIMSKVNEAWANLKGVYFK